MAKVSGVCLVIAATALLLSVGGAAMHESMAMRAGGRACGGGRSSRSICKEFHMSVLPESRTDLLQFCEAHASLWAANATGLGINAAKANAFKTTVTAARQAYDDAEKAREAAKAATALSNGQLGLMRTAAAGLIRDIKTYAEQQANPTPIYALAQIPAPAQPSPLPLPGKPTDILVTLLATGAVQISWDAENAAASSGVFFNIYRKLPGANAWVSLGGTSGTTSTSRRMTFTDATVPTSAAAAGVQYVMQGQRGTAQGLLSDAITVQFGTDTPGGLSVMNANAKKLAA